MSRQRPWRAEHPDAVIVSRGTALGNPFRVYEHCKGSDWGVEDTGRFNMPLGHGWTKLGAIEAAIVFYRHAFDEAYPEFGTAREILLMSLRGRDIACWCPTTQPCHGDFLFELANGAQP